MPDRPRRSGSLSASGVRDRVDGYGAAGPLVFIAVSSLLTVVLFPGPLLAGASGLLFGTALGFPVTLVSAVLGASIAFSLSRWWAHDAVLELAGRRLLALRAWLGRREFLSVLYARIAPGMPYTLVNYAAGLTTIRLGVFAAATALGTAPRAFAYTALGGSLGNLRSPEALVAFAVLAVMALAGALLVRRDARG
ncbi:MAG: TVP38/TMEM64 family protein [Actinomycetota bacterium]|nr:TVP38/TMEM64 family protein [Actinomycetota bacterium]